MTSEEQVQRLPIEREMKKSYLDYSMSVIVGRALPDVRDGLKPVHRRILYALQDMGLRHAKPHRKSARAVGEVLGKYHPHGDAAVYDAMVRMAQDFSLRYPLIDGQGNFGSIDGDSPAAMRYTEVRLDRRSEEMLRDLDKETVEWRDNFDGTLKEPVILPAVLPNLLVNGASGIAVGMATNMPPHNLGEVVDALLAYLDDPEQDVPSLMQHLQGPDFPTGGIICGRRGILEAYATGKGIIKLRARTHVEGDAIIVTEIPYQTSKAGLLQKIAQLVKKEVIEGIADLRDESDRQGVRVVIKLKRDAMPEVVENQLFKHTGLESTFGIINIALVDGQPKLLSLKELMQAYVDHRRDIIQKRTTYDLLKARERKHILDGLLTALESIDRVIELIRASSDAAQAAQQLMEAFSLSELQVKEILSMRLQSLTSMEAESLRAERKEKESLIARLDQILTTPGEIDRVIRQELQEMKERYGDPRRTTIEEGEVDVDMEALIPEEEVVIVVTSQGYIKRLSLDEYRAQNRGGKGLVGIKMKEDDAISNVLVSSTHDYVLIFSDQGIVYAVKGYQIPAGGRHSKGRAVVNLIPIEGNIRAILSVTDFESGTLIFATKNGIVKKTHLSRYQNIRVTGIRALSLKEGDALVKVKLLQGDEKIVLASASGSACVFNEKEVRPMGRVAAGVIGMRLEEGDEVVDMAIARGDDILTVTENGYGKRTPLEEYRVTRRGAKGVRTIITNQRNGRVVAVREVSDGDQVVLSSREGMMVRIPVDSIRRQGRNTMGVTLMNLNPGDQVVTVTKV
ncbi:MAG: DNA gyrase subunit A [Candidatus Thermoplasmatota archaeon]|nr:DNA gyrase subunit A [Candidatus Thermoplasmatota archaeon]